ncbi:hypothetical protein XH87_00615 [Bradyrhizobium sp. CCBAU 53415]|nr:hypothetical protein [Bradyrhizobium sp. CCBAU 53415]
MLVAVSFEHRRSLSLGGHPLDLWRRYPSLSAEVAMQEKAETRNAVSPALEEQSACELWWSSGSQAWRSNLAIFVPTSIGRQKAADGFNEDDDISP